MKNMKKTFITISVLAVFCLSSFTSHAGGGPFTKGPIAGWHYSDILKDGESLYGENNNSFFVGFFSNRKLGSTKLFQIGSALMYYQNGSRKDDNNYIRLHYLNIPVSLRVQIGPVYGFAGVNGAIKLGGEQYTLGVKTDVKSINTWDAGVHAGIGAKIFMFGVEAKYNWGLVDINNGYKSQYLQLGILLYIGGKE
jgi:hypothetical protein